MEDKAVAAARGRAKLDEFRRKKGGKKAPAASGNGGGIASTKASENKAPAPELPPLATPPSQPEVSPDDAGIVAATQAEPFVNELPREHSGSAVLALPEVSSSARAAAYASLSASYYDDELDEQLARSSALHIPALPPVVLPPTLPAPQRPPALVLPPPPAPRPPSPEDALRGASVLAWLQAPTGRAPGLDTPPVADRTEQGAAVTSAAVVEPEPDAPAAVRLDFSSSAVQPEPPLATRAVIPPAVFSSTGRSNGAPNSGWNDTLAAHIEELTRDKLALQRQLDNALQVTAHLANEHDGLVSAFNAQGAKLEAAHAALEFAMASADAAAAAASTAEKEADVAKSGQRAALARCGVLAADAIQLEERLLQCRRREARATSRLARDSARADEATAKAAALGTLATRLAKEKRRLLRRLRALASERELAGLPSLPSGFFSLAEGAESDGEQNAGADGDDDIAALRIVNGNGGYDTSEDSDDAAVEDGGGSLEPRTPAPSLGGRLDSSGALDDTPGAGGAPPNTPAVGATPHATPNGSAHVGDGADAAARDALARINLLLSDLEQRHAVHATPHPAGPGADVHELAAANAALSKRLALAQRKLEEAGLSLFDDDDDEAGDDSSDDGQQHVTKGTSPGYNNRGWLFGGGARRRGESLVALAAAHVGAPSPLNGDVSNTPA